MELFFFSVFKLLLLNISIAVILTVEKQTSEIHLSKEMHMIQMVQEQNAIYFGYAFLGVLG